MGRMVVVSLNPEPAGWRDTHDGVWITAIHNSVNQGVANSINIAMRMQPDELVISRECFGLFLVKENKKAKGDINIDNSPVIDAERNTLLKGMMGL